MIKIAFFKTIPSALGAFIGASIVQILIFSGFDVINVLISTLLITIISFFINSFIIFHRTKKYENDINQ